MVFQDVVFLHFSASFYTTFLRSCGRGESLGRCLFWCHNSVLFRIRWSVVVVKEALVCVLYYGLAHFYWYLDKCCSLAYSPILVQL